MSHAKLDIAAVVAGLAAATTYMAVPVTWKGRTLGQSLVGLVVIDACTNGPVPVVRALSGVSWSSLKSRSR